MIKLPYSSIIVASVAYLGQTRRVGEERMNIYGGHFVDVSQYGMDNIKGLLLGGQTGLI